MSGRRVTRGRAVGARPRVTRSSRRAAGVVVPIRSSWRGVFAGVVLLAATLVAVLPTRTSAQRATLRPSTAFGGTAVIHESWSVSDGLPVNAINHLIQSRDGYIWAATFDGLVRFDGVKFTVFNSANSPGLPSNRIIRLEEDPRGDLWLVTEQGHLIRRRAGQFRLLMGSGRSNDIRLAHGGDGTTWVGTIDGLSQVRDDRVVPVLRDQRWSCTWRYAGGIIADMQQKGDYIDWYCSGIAGGDEPDVYEQAQDLQRKNHVSEGEITAEVREDFLRLGWWVVTDRGE